MNSQATAGAAWMAGPPVIREPEVRATWSGYTAWGLTIYWQADNGFRESSGKPPLTQIICVTRDSGQNLFLIILVRAAGPDRGQYHHAGVVEGATE